MRCAEMAKHSSGEAPKCIGVARHRLAKAERTDAVNSAELLSDGEARKEARSVDEICRAAAVMMCGRGVPPDVVASVLHVPLNRIRRWTERR